MYNHNKKSYSFFDSESSNDIDYQICIKVKGIVAREIFKYFSEVKTKL